VGLAVVLLARAAVAAPPATTTTLPFEAVPTAAPRPIPIPQIASQAEDTVTRLRTIEAAAAPVRTVDDIVHRIPDLEARVSEATSETYRVLKENLTLAALDGLLDPWMNVREQAKVWVNLLTARAENLDALLKRLDDIRVRWSVTRDAAPPGVAPVATVGRIADTLVLIASGARSRVRAARPGPACTGSPPRCCRVPRGDARPDQSNRRALFGQLFVRRIPVWGTSCSRRLG
jgi:hypothetical protein